MKKVALVVMAVLTMSGSLPVFAAEKDECLLASQNCKDQVDTIQQKVKRINVEIKKGKKVYTVNELRTLQAGLKEANDMMDELMKPGR